MSRDDLVVTTGATEALHLTLRAFVRPGDVIATESPTYYGALQAIESLGCRVLEIPTDPHDGISIEHLEKALRRQTIAGCFVMPNFHNPLGCAMPDDRKEGLVRILARAEVPLVEDDVAGDLYFGHRRPLAAKAFDKKGLVLYCSSVSKTLAPGFRVGWLIAGRFHDRVLELQWTTTGAASSPGQLALAEYLTSNAYDRYLRRLRATLSLHAQRMAELVARTFPEGTTVTRPQGGLVSWVGLPPGVASIRVFEAARAAKIAVLPGDLFSARGSCSRHLRLCYAHPWTRELQRAVAGVGEVCRSLRRPEAQALKKAALAGKTRVTPGTPRCSPRAPAPSPRRP